MEPKGKFQCGYCSTRAFKGIFCEKHMHMWEKLKPISKEWIITRVVIFNAKWFPSHSDHKKLQHDINKTVNYGNF